MVVVVVRVVRIVVVAVAVEARVEAEVEVQLQVEVVVVMLKVVFVTDSLGEFGSQVVLLSQRGAIAQNGLFWRPKSKMPFLCTG